MSTYLLLRNMKLISKLCSHHNIAEILKLVLNTNQSIFSEITNPIEPKLYINNHLIIKRYRLMFVSVIEKKCLTFNI